MRKKALATLVAIAGSGAFLGWASGENAPHPESLVGARSPLTAPLQHGESAFSVELEPVAIDQDKDGEHLRLSAALGNKEKDSRRAIVSVRLEDDRGHEATPVKISAPLEVRADEKAWALDFTTPSLADGFYRATAHAVFSDQQEMRGAEMTSVFIEVSGGKIEILDFSDFFGRSNAHEARPQ